MIYALHPFPRPPAKTGPEQPLPDIRETLASRPACQNERAVANTLLLDVIVDGLHDIGVPFYITHCHETHGDLHLSVTAAGQGHEVAAGDELRGGLFIRNSETCRFETLVCTRLFRVVCENGALMECEKEQSFTIAEEGAPLVTGRRRSNESFSFRLIRSTYAGIFGVLKPPQIRLLLPPTNSCYSCTLSD
jgi:hypothetical protein